MTATSLELSAHSANVLSPPASISMQWPTQISAALEHALAVSIRAWCLAPPMWWCGISWPIPGRALAETAAAPIANNIPRRSMLCLLTLGPGAAGMLARMGAMILRRRYSRRVVYSTFDLLNDSFKGRPSRSDYLKRQEWGNGSNSQDGICLEEWVQGKALTNLPLGSSSIQSGSVTVPQRKSPENRLVFGCRSSHARCGHSFDADDLQVDVAHVDPGSQCRGNAPGLVRKAVAANVIG